MYILMYVLWSYRPSVVSTDQLWVVLDKLCWVLYVDCVSLTPSVLLDACVLATTAALQNSMFSLLYFIKLFAYISTCACMWCHLCM